DDVGAVVAVEQVRAADVDRADVGVPDQRLLVVGPRTAVGGPTAPARPAPACPRAPAATSTAAPAAAADRRPRRAW
ncbi:hypothetical protein, partial [Streptomyces sp. Agncl-13]|uniref:hypothetical protein n=1 Tax=Streptomyces sp. Agncl-13 TaxID=3400628 RepID=UPI003A8BC28D